MWDFKTARFLVVVICLVGARFLVARLVRTKAVKSRLSHWEDLFQRPVVKPAIAIWVSITFIASLRDDWFKERWKWIDFLPDWPLSIWLCIILTFLLGCALEWSFKHSELKDSRHAASVEALTNGHAQTLKTHCDETKEQLADLQEEHRNEISALQQELMSERNKNQRPDISLTILSMTVSRSQNYVDTPSGIDQILRTVNAYIEFTVELFNSRPACGTVDYCFLSIDLPSGRKVDVPNSPQFHSVRVPHGETIRKAMNFVFKEDYLIKGSVEGSYCIDCHPIEDVAVFRLSARDSYGMVIQATPWSQPQAASA